MKVSYKMDMKWFKQFKAEDEDAKEKVRNSLRSANHILEAAIEILNKEKASLERPTKEDYDCPAWSHKQAHNNGEIAALNKVINLLTIKDKS